MHCVRCGKPLTKFTVSIPTAEGPVGWGPRCSKTVIVSRTRSNRGFRVDPAPRRAVPADPRQLDLIEATP